MALGGGAFTVQNKVLPGTYINFVSAASANAALSERGIATMPLELDWGREGEVFEVTGEEFRKNSLKIFGYGYIHEKMKGLRDLFLNAQTLYAYRVNGGEKAENKYAKAKYSGLRGNDLTTVIQANVDNETLFDVKLLLGAEVVDEQTVALMEELAANDYVEWKTDAVLETTAGLPFSGGTNGTIKGGAYQEYLDKIESYTFNTMGAAVTDPTTKALFVSFTKRLREEMGIKFQLVLHNESKADYYGVISVKNDTLDDGWNAAGLVFWVTGASAGCLVNRSNQNKVYDGEFHMDADFTQSGLKAAIASGEFVFHKVGAELRVLADINTMVTLTDGQGEIFQENQTIRVIDQIGNDLAVLFSTKYLGVIPNDNAGRVSLWSDIVDHYRQLAQIGAIEGFSDADVTVEQGGSRKSVVVKDAVTVVNAMGKLYMTVTIA